MFKPLCLVCITIYYFISSFSAARLNKVIAPTYFMIDSIESESFKFLNTYDVFKEHFGLLS